MGFHEGAQEILVAANRSLLGVLGRTDRDDLRFRGSAVYLYPFLKTVRSSRFEVRSGNQLKFKV